MYDPSQLYVDPILTNLSVGWQDQVVYGLRIYPETPVRTKSGRYRVFDRSDWLIHRSRREPGTVANEVGARKWSEDVFATEEHSLQHAIEDEERQQLTSQGGLADPVLGGDLQIDPEGDAVDYIMRALTLEHERTVANSVRNVANYTSGHHVALTGSQKWSDYTYITAGDPNSVVSNPIAILKTAFQRIYLDTGRWPNTMTIPFDAVGVIENHPRVVSRFQYVAVTDAAAWRTLLGLPESAVSGLNVFVVDSKYNTADNIDAAESIASFWGQDVWVGIVDQTPGQKTKTFGKTFAQLYPDGSVRPTDRWREEQRKSDLVRTSWSYDVKIISPDAGYLIQNAVVAVT